MLLEETHGLLLKEKFAPYVGVEDCLKGGGVIASELSTSKHVCRRI